MAWHLGFSLASSAFFIYALFHKIGKHDMNHCLSRHSNDSNKDEECRKEFHYYRGAIIVLIVIFWLLELCASLFFLHPPDLLTLCGPNCLLMDVQGVGSLPPITSHN